MSTGRQLVVDFKDAHLYPEDWQSQTRVRKKIYAFLYKAIFKNQWQELLAFVDDFEAVSISTEALFQNPGLLPVALVSHTTAIVRTLYDFAELGLGQLYTRNFIAMGVDHAVHTVLSNFPQGKSNSMTLAEFTSQLESKGVADATSLILLLSKMKLISLYIYKGIQKVKLGKHYLTYSIGRSWM